MPQTDEHEQRIKIAEDIYEKFYDLILKEVLEKSLGRLDVTADIVSMVIALFVKGVIENIYDNGGEVASLRAFANISINMVDGLLTGKEALEKYRVKH